MSAINFPLTTTSLFVNTINTNKIIYLPAASTINAGRLFYIKDICGNAARSSIYISTLGMDRIENRSSVFAAMSTNYGSILMAPDGALNWYFLQHYHRNAISSLGITLTSITPSSIVNLALWLDGADASTITTVTGVSQWNDKSGNAYNLTQSTTNLQPTRTGNYLNFQSSYYLNVPFSAMNNMSTWSIFLVINPISASNWIMVKQKDGANTYNVISMTYNTNNGGGGQLGTSGYLYWRSYNAGAQAVSTGAVATSTIQIVNLIYDGTNLYFYKNGTLENTTAGAFAILNDTGPSSYTLGCWIQGGSQVNNGVTNFQLGELVSYSTNLNTTQRQNIEGYLAVKWGISYSLPIGHPYLT